MRCEQVKEWMNDRLDGCLDDGQGRELDAHLAGCEACRREWEELRQTVTLIRGLPAVVPPSNLLDAVRARVERKRESPMLVFWRVLSLPQTRVAVAAGLVIVVGYYGLQMMATAPAVRPERVSDVAPEKLAPMAAAPVPVVVEKVQPVVEKRLEAVREERADAGRAREGGAIWAEGDARSAGQDNSQHPPGLSVGYDPAARAERAPVDVEVVSELQEEAVDAAPVASGRTKAARRSVIVADKLKAPRLEASPKEGKKEVLLPAAPAVALSKGGVSPVDAPALEVTVATSDASAVHKILSQYVVRKDVADAVPAVADSKAMDLDSGGTIDEAFLVSGWIPAAQYDRLMAELRGLGGLPAATPRATAPASHGGKASEADAGLVFVRIRLAAPGK